MMSIVGEVVHELTKQSSADKTRDGSIVNVQAQSEELSTKACLSALHQERC